MMDLLSYIFVSDLHKSCNNGYGVYYPVYGVRCIKYLNEVAAEIFSLDT